MIWTPASTKPELGTYVDRHKDVSVLHSDLFLAWLTDVATYVVFGGEPVEFDVPWAHRYLVEKDPAGDTSRALEMAWQCLRDNHHPRPPGGVRAIQFVVGGEQRQTRCNGGIRGHIWGKLDPVPDFPDKLNAMIGFSLLQDEGALATHVTALSGTFEGRPSAMVFADLVPSAIRRQAPQEIARMVAKGLPRLARKRFFGLVREARDANELDELRTLLSQAYLARRDSMGDCKGVMRRGLATEILEELERSRRAGLPARGSSIEILTSEDPLRELAESSNTLVDGPSTGIFDHPALARLPARTQEILRLRYLEDLTQDDVAKHFGLKQSRVSQIETQALLELRRNLRGDSSPSA